MTRYGKMALCTMYAISPCLPRGAVLVEESSDGVRIPVKLMMIRLSCNKLLARCVTAFMLIMRSV